MDNNKDGIDTAFDVMNQIFSDNMYAARVDFLTPSLKNGLDAYKKKSDWASYKAEYFSVQDNTFIVKK